MTEATTPHQGEREVRISKIHRMQGMGIIPYAQQFAKKDSIWDIIARSEWKTFRDSNDIILNTEVQVTSEQITKGTFVRIVSGPLNGVSGEVVEIRGKRSIVLRFNNLGFCVHAELGANKVEVVK